MPKTRGKRTATKRKVDYKDNDSSESESDLGMLSSILELFMQQKSTRKKKRPVGRPPKKKSDTARCATHCHCCHCSKTVPQGRCGTQKTPTRGRPKGSKTAKPSTSTKLDTSIELDSEEEINSSIKQSQADNIKNKVDSFFKALESDDDEVDKKSSPTMASCDIPPEMKTKDFYTITSDSEDDKFHTILSDSEDAKKKYQANKLSTVTSTVTSSSLETGTTCESVSFNNNKTNISNDSPTVNPKTNPDDLFAYVDDILNEYNTVDITDDKSTVPELSLEDLKKKTDEILGDVASMIDDLKPKPKEPEEKPPQSPVKEAPICPICLEQLGGTRQAMVTLCGHMFCEPCIQQVVKSTKKCPSCRKGVTKTKYHPVYL